LVLDGFDNNECMLAKIQFSLIVYKFFFRIPFEWSGHTACFSSFDRGLITSCQCSCEETAAWCEHANALCIYRISRKEEVSLRSPVSESLSRLERDQLQKFAQYLISELPQQVSNIELKV